MEITVHDWIEIIGAAVAVGGFISGMRALRSDVNDLKKDMKLLNQVVMDMALSKQRQDNFERATNERLEAQNKRFDKLEALVTDIQHGKNLIRD